MQQYQLGQGPYGSAYQGTIDDLFSAGDLAPVELNNYYGRSYGLFLGQFDWTQTIRHVWDEPVTGLWAWLTKKRVQHGRTETIQQVHDLRFTGDAHHIVVASTGAGKFRDVLSNMLLYDGSCETACIIIDPKGEIAKTIGAMIDAPGTPDPRTVILDPWDLCGTGTTDSLTLLDGIQPSNPHCVKDARVLADAIIIEKNDKDGHWAETAKNLLAALILYLCLHPAERGHRTLPRLREIVTEPWKNFCNLLGLMSESRLCGGVVARTAQGLLNREDKEQRAIMSTLERDTTFIDDPTLWNAIDSSTFDMNDLVMSNKRIHVIVPFDYTDQMKSWLRLTIAAFYNACLRQQLSPDLPKYLRFRHIVIDEFAGLGKLDFIMKGVAEARGAGVKYHLVIQNFPQLHAIYKDGWENIVSNSFIHAFGVNENFTAEYLSKKTGKATVVTESSGYNASSTHGTSTSTSTTGGQKSDTTSNSSSHSTTTGSSTTFASTGREVLTPDEVCRIPANQQLLFLNAMPVLLTRRTPYYETFKRFLPRHTLSDIFNSAAIGVERKLTPFGLATLYSPTSLMAANARPRLPTFSPPPYRRDYTFKEAWQQSPFAVPVAALLAVLSVLWIVTAIAQWNSSRLAAIKAAHDAEVAAIYAQEQRRLDDIARAAQLKADNEVRARATAVDRRIMGPYSTLASNISNALAQTGMCSTAGAVNSSFSCTDKASYDGGLGTFGFRMTAARRQFMTLSVASRNSERRGAFDGAHAEMSVQSVYQDVDFGSSDAARLLPSIRTVVGSTLSAFGVSAQILNNCRDGGQSFSGVVNGTSVTCGFTPRPETGGLSNFSLTLDRRM